MAYDDPAITAKRYALLSDKALTDFAKNFNELTPTARDLLRAEFQSRNLAMPAPPPPPAPNTSHKPIAEPGYIPVPEEGDDLQVEAEAESAVAETANFITVRSYRDLSEAFVARSVLEQAGIPCILRDEHTLGMVWAWSNLMGGARLQVSEDDVAIADELLSQPMPASFSVDSGEDYQQPACPKCGSIDVMEDDADRKRNATGLLAGSFFPPMPLLVGAMNLAKSPTDLWKCNNCGCRWSDDVLPGPAPQ
jgi:hypothetical protein